MLADLIFLYIFACCVGAMRRDAARTAVKARRSQEWWDNGGNPALFHSDGTRK
jgi:hypothetical protein